MLSRRDFVQVCLGGISLAWWRPALVTDPEVVAREWFYLLAKPSWDDLVDQADHEQLRGLQRALCRAARAAASTGLWNEFNRNLKLDSPAVLASLSPRELLRLLRAALDRSFPGYSKFMVDAGFETLGCVRDGPLAYVLYRYNAATMARMMATKPFLVRLRQRNRGWALLFDLPPQDFVPSRHSSSQPQPFELQALRVVGMIPAGPGACYFVVDFEWHMPGSRETWTKPFSWYCDEASDYWPLRNDLSALTSVLKEQSESWRPPQATRTEKRTP
jgi:hypothetical protein